MKKESPHLFIQKKEIQDLKIDEKLSDWNRNAKNQSIILPGELEIMSLMQEALQKDREIHRVKKKE